ncbi:MAG: precorrin-6Y C5,15-methyltransferase (decarboxylating) subunit CbiT [Lachnospiraceae bacterium]|jgi:precorrin-6Y C5,15-methyltransferase (decarboxylating)|nr:precorrin-6Y C5,15-methyltransferase (decarboxylating) subunit CbiT [Lachnospiraceae bacterium]
MKKQVILAGIGPGNTLLATRQVCRDIETAQVVIGAPRMIGMARKLSENGATPGKSGQMTDKKRYVEQYLPDQIAQIIKESEESRYCVLMSGDSGFYSGTKKLSALLRDEGYQKSAGVQIEIHPGISSLSYLCAAFGKDYNEVSIASLHGRNENIAYRVHTHRLTFVLMEGDGCELAKRLCEYGLADVKIYAGFFLSYEAETLFSCRACEYGETFEQLLKSRTQLSEGPLLCLLIENEKNVNPADSFRDGDFIRGNVPMTKAEIRCQICSMLELKKDGVLYDIGAGTGAVTLELARKIPFGTAYAIEYTKQGAELIRQNCRKHSMDQVKVVEGMAPQALTDLQDADAVFIGGSRGRLRDILTALKEKKAGQRLPVVISAVTTETWKELMELACEAVNEKKADRKETIGLSEVSVIQLQTSRMMPLGSYHRMEPQSPIWLLKGYL